MRDSKAKDQTKDHHYPCFNKAATSYHHNHTSHMQHVFGHIENVLRILDHSRFVKLLVRKDVLRGTHMVVP